MEGAALWGTLSLLVFVSGARAQSIFCGSAPLNTKTRIVGGETASPGSWPWQVSLQRNGFHFCGGSLISDEWILTAAHCFQGSGDTTSGLAVVLGEDSLTTSSSNQLSRSVSEIINHPSYSSSNNNNDMSLLKLSDPVSYTDYIQPVCLTAANTAPDVGSDVWVTGWGTLSSGGSSPDRLQEVMVPVVSQSQCSDSYASQNIDITNNMICAGQAGKDSCQGDSGGPLVYKINGSWVQTGVVSFGIGCALSQYPGVYARVSEYTSWISGHTSRTAGFMDAAGNLSSRAAQLSPPLSLALSVLLALLVFYLHP